MGSRRAVGALVLVVALLALIAVTAVSRPRLPGTPSAAPPPGPPAVGECVLASVSYPTASPGRSPQLVYPQATIGPCRGDRHAEVAVILTDPAPPPPASPGDNPYGPGRIDTGDDRNLDACSARIQPYLGAPGALTVVDGWLDSRSAPSPSIIAPTPLQSAAGQHWLGCIISPAADAVPFSYSLRDAYLSAWPAADGFATCFVYGPAQDPTSISCDGPHGGEIFAWDYGDADASTRQATCTARIKAATGLTDPTAGGRLTVQVDNTSRGGQCAVIVTNPVQTLGHSLRNLGTRPVPWA